MKIVGLITTVLVMLIVVGYVALRLFLSQFPIFS